MQKHIAGLIALTAVLALAGPAAAETGLYANGGYTHYDADDASLGGITGRLGYQFHPNVAVEGEGSFGVKGDTVGAAKVKLDHSLGVFGVGIVPITPKFDVFGRLGYAQTKVHVSTPGGGSDQDGVAYGAGAQYMISSRFGVRGDYTRFEGDNNGTDTVSATAVVKF